MNIKYPPISYFPNHPDLSSVIGKKPMSETGNQLSFEYGFDGVKRIIRPSSSPYLDFVYYDYKNRVWIIPQLVLKTSDTNIATDITDYESSNILGFDRMAGNIYDDLKFYFDGEKLTTNYDFSNEEDQKAITVEYFKITDNLKVKATMISLTNNVSLATPTIDQYTLIVSRQKIYKA